MKGHKARGMSLEVIRRATEGNQEVKMRLKELLDGLTVSDLRGDSEIEIAGLAYDSRAVKPGYLFVALRGHAYDGHDFIENALKRGALALVAEQFRRSDTKATMIRVPDSRKALSRLAATYYDQPFKGINLIGITGTNGKTTVAFLVRSIINSANQKCGMIGTVFYDTGSGIKDAPLTTPDCITIANAQKQMVGAGLKYMVIEASSHALSQNRLAEINFSAAAFTNLMYSQLLSISRTKSSAR